MERSFEDLQLAHDAIAAGDVSGALKHLSWRSDRPATMIGHTVVLFAALLSGRRQRAS
ncbi:MAG: hypothetical protein ABI551_05045 [Polyangiaceae bacterium]